MRYTWHMRHYILCCSSRRLGSRPPSLQEQPYPIGVRTLPTLSRVEASLVPISSPLRITVARPLVSLSLLAPYCILHTSSQTFLFPSNPPCLSFFYELHSLSLFCPPEQSIPSFTASLFLFSDVSFSRDTMSDSSFTIAFLSDFGKTPAQRGLSPGAVDNLFVQASERHVTAGTAFPSEASDDGESDLCRTLQNHGLSCTDDCGQIVIDSPKISAKFQGTPY